tara:strand:+ start:861 stop:1292 length:432 start_codon:yes stop_codon:yes gene_type:complete
MNWQDIIKFGGRRPSFSQRHTSSVPLADKIKEQLEDAFSPQGEEDQCCEYVKDLYNKRLYERYEEALELVKDMNLTPEEQKMLDSRIKDLKNHTDDHKEMMDKLSCEAFKQHLENEKGDKMSEDLFDITGLLKEWEECEERMN